ncbi:hypothetical protein [Bosea sp. Leaf344]|uniref:hypothetical protein n=1 Tax=Bosea sp. Leaf344 TaxID=1736346 RepID=UPI0012E3BB6E|nr:hypothetical protein [Bosea sp. Leaf344]
MEQIYRSKNLLVKAAHRGGVHCVVTFDPHAEDEQMKRLAFGEEFFDRHSISVVHVLSRRNRWYHEADWRKAITAVKSAASGYQRVITYGSSMGGYGALRFASAIGAQLALALAPQYSVDPRKAPFETRWPRARRVRWLSELSGPLSADVPAIIVYDSAMQLERQHVDLIAGEMPIQRVALPNSGHHIGAYLAECGLLGAFALGAVNGELDLASLRQEARQRRRRSPHRLMAISQKAFKRAPEAGILIARRAVDLAPNANFAWTNLGILLGRARRWQDAIKAHEKSVACDPRHSLAYIPLAIAFRESGDLPAALGALKTAESLNGSLDRRLNIWMVRLGILMRLTSATAINPALKFRARVRKLLFLP